MPALRSEDILQFARGWLGTPYHHQACTRGVGTDCLGLIRGVWREAYGSDPAPPPPYSQDWGEANGVETLISAANKHLVPIGLNDAAPGSVLIFRMRPGAIAKHAGLMSGASRMIHATEGKRVAEIELTAWWRRRIAAAYNFPGVY